MWYKILKNIKRDVIKIYKYTYASAKTAGLLRLSDHRELIDKYSKEGWRFIVAIPIEFNGFGDIKEFDLVFEKEE